MAGVFALRLIGIASVQRAFAGAGGRLNRGLASAMQEVVHDLVGEATRRIRGKRSSNPPELLGVVSGRLRQSITGRVSQTIDVVRGTVGPQRVVYAAIHEFGGEAGRTTARVNIPARPYLSTALEARRAFIVARLGDAVQASVLATSD